ncbi:unnamed protein product [Allacma fusca]|uniref:C2 domain-containing protein n=1 Tax=Allacma fusca TaxID=39272 RepID=A0A8J2LUK5_9HEXA|nr:unnamed protein product [Allacma fusca]
MFKALLILSIVTVWVVQAQPIQKQKLRFKLSAKGIPDKDDIGTTDPYVELYYTEDGSSKEHKFGRSATISDNENPVWGDVFEFDYDRSKGQRWHFKIKDHDNLREDDTVGKAWVIVDDYVDKGQTYTANLHKKGTITVQSLDPVTQTTPQVVLVNHGGQVVQAVVQPTPQVVQPGVATVVQPGVPTVVQPQTVVQPGVQTIVQPQQVVIVQPQKLRFQLSARGLDDLDLIGTTDAYVKAFFTDDVTRLESQFGRTAPINDSENPSWSETLEFDYIKGKKQRWHFQVLDQDDNRRDDEVGDAFIDVDDYVSKGENAVLKLKKGQLIVKRL